MDNFGIASAEKTGALPGDTSHSPSDPQSQQRVAGQDGDYISKTAKPNVSTKLNTIPRGDGQPPVEKKNKTPERSRFSRAMDGFWSTEGWLSLIAVSIAASVFVSLVAYLIHSANSNSSNGSKKV